MKKPGRPSIKWEFAKDDIIHIYKICIDVFEHQISMNEGAELLEKYDVSRGSAYKLFNNFNIMTELIDNKVDLGLILRLDQILRVYDFIVAGRELIKGEDNNE